MSDILIKPSRLAGKVKVPLSKSAAHRAVICSAAAGDKSIISEGENISNDIACTQRAVSEIIDAKRTGKSNITINCGESGSTLRFLVPFAAAFGISAVFTGSGRLPSRPIGVYLDCLPKHGVSCESGGGLPLKISGKLTPGVFSVPGNVSSQFITGLLLSLPLLGKKSEIRLLSPLESAGYADMTVKIMADFGVHVEKTKNGWLVPGNQEYKKNSSYKIERDWSQAAFFIAAGALGGNIEIEGLDFDSKQGDRAAETLFKKFGADIKRKSGNLIARPGHLKGIKIDASQIPDLVPVLAAAASLCEGQTVICNAGRLRLKESDRLAAMAGGLRRLGGNVSETRDGLVINGVKRLKPGKVYGCGDHRVVMAFSIAALMSCGDVIITDSESVKKSYPDFFRDYKSLGGKAYYVGK